MTAAATTTTTTTTCANIATTLSLDLSRCGVRSPLVVELATSHAVEAVEYPSEGEGYTSALDVVVTLFCSEEESDIGERSSEWSDGGGDGSTGTWLDAPIELALAREVVQRAVLETLCMVQALSSKAATELELDMWTSVKAPHRLLALRIAPGRTTPAEALHSLFEDHTQLMVNALLEEQQL